MILRRAGDIAAHHAEGLGQRAFDDVDAMHHAVALGDAAAARAVEADAVHLVEIGHRAVALRRDRRSRRSARNRRPSNRRTRSDDLRRAPDRRARSSSSRCAMSLWRKIRFSRLPRRMPSIIEAWFSSSEKMMQPGKHACQRRQRRVVRDVARREQQRRFLAVQIGELALQLDVEVGGAGDVARAARAGAGGVDRLVHGGEHLRVLAHAEIVVGAPDRDRRCRLLACGARRSGTRRGGARCRRRPDSGLRASVSITHRLKRLAVRERHSWSHSPPLRPVLIRASHERIAQVAVPPRKSSAISCA